MRRVMHRRWAISALIVGIVVGALAATAAAVTERNSSSQAADKQIRIGLVLPALSNPFIAPVKTGAEAQA